MDLRAGVVAPCSPEELFVWVDDLAHYPQWMPLVHRAVPAAGDEGAWSVELRARVGPLARSKRLRMVRTVIESPRRVAFERAELDGRSHAPWILAVDLDPAGGPTGSPATVLSMRLRYGGGLWTGGLLERVLIEQIEQGKRNLLALVSEPTR